MLVPRNLYLQSIVADNAQVDAITGKAVRMDGEMVHVSTNAGTGAIGLQTWEAAHNKRAVRWGLSSCCASTTEAQLLAEATMMQYGNVQCTEYFCECFTCKCLTFHLT